MNSRKDMAPYYRAQAAKDFAHGLIYTHALTFVVGALVGATVALFFVGV